MEIHKLFTFIGAILLLATFGIYYFNDKDPSISLDFAYVTGIAMIIFFMISFGMFNIDRWKKSKKPKT